MLWMIVEFCGEWEYVRLSADCIRHELPFWSFSRDTSTITSTPLSARLERVEPSAEYTLPMPVTQGRPAQPIQAYCVPTSRVFLPNKRICARKAGTPARLQSSNNMRLISAAATA